jgi:acetoacetyl-CoA synthetase
MGSGSLTRRKLPTMGTDKQGDLLWEPSEERIERATMTRYMGWLKDERGLEFDDYAALWEWSTDDL